MTNKSDEQRRPKLAYLTGEYPKVSHTFIQREVEALRHRGMSVETFSVRHPGNKNILADQKSEEASTCYILNECKRPLTLMSAHFSKLLSSPSLYFQALALAWKLRQPGLKSALYQLFYFAEAVILARELRRRRVDHLHNHFADSSCTVALLASELTGIPFSFTEHGPAIFFEARRWHLDKKIAHAEFVVAISHFCRSQLMLFSQSQHWEKIAIVHCGVDPTRYRPAISRDAGKHLVYVGRLEPVKGLPVLLEAAAEVRKVHPDMHLTIVGDGSSRPQLEASADALGLGPVTSFVGYRTQQEVADLLGEVDMLVLPSFAEGVPVVLMEAMASGIPVVASRVAGIQELVVDGVNGVTVPPGDAVALAQCISRLLADAGLRQRMGFAGREIVEQKYNIDREAYILGDFFSDEARWQSIKASRMDRADLFRMEIAGDRL